MKRPWVRVIGMIAVLCVGAAGTVGLAPYGFASSVPVSGGRLTSYRSCTLSATPSSTTSVTDATVKQATPTTAAGTASTIVVSSSTNANQRIYVRFDLTRCSPAIPATATVSLATLRLFATTLAAACRTIDVFRVPTTWTEATLTWNNEPFGTAINNPAAGSRTDSFNVGTPAGCENLTANAYISGAIVTADVAAYVAGSATNAGWMLRDDVEGSSTARSTTFVSKEAAVVNRAPQLIVSWTALP